MDDTWYCPGCRAQFNNQTSYLIHLSTSQKQDCQQAYDKGRSHASFIENFGFPNEAGPSRSSGPIRDYFGDFDPRDLLDTDNDNSSKDEAQPSNFPSPKPSSSPHNTPSPSQPFSPLHDGPNLSQSSLPPDLFKDDDPQLDDLEAELYADHKED